MIVRFPRFAILRRPRRTLICFFRCIFLGFTFPLSRDASAICLLSSRPFYALAPVDHVNHHYRVAIVFDHT